MIAIKLAGSLLILAAGGFAAFGKAKGEQQRLGVLDAWIDLLSHVRGQIDLYLTPMDEILRSADRSILERLGVTAGSGGVRACLQASLSRLDAESRRLLLIWSRECGRSYREEELRRCDHTLRALKEHRDRLSAALPSRIKLTVALPLCLALGTAILLW